MSFRTHVSTLALIKHVFLLFSIVRGGWVDPDTPEKLKKVQSYEDSTDFELVFSDEFNVEGRNFNDGYDPKWTSMDKDDYTNFALHYYNSELAKTSNGYLNITTVLKDISFTVLPNALDKTPGREKKPTKKVKNYQSAMVQGWNKFCFTGGIIEISGKLPGNAYIGGLWPAMWMLGNLARATYVGSSNNMWPWSYDECSKKMQKQQLVSGCNKVNHYDFHPYKGRGAPEIDILEAMPGKEKLGKLVKTNKPYFSTSLQIAPGIPNIHPVVGELPPKNWYKEGIKIGENTSTNIFFYGMKLEGVTPDRSYSADAISANTNLQQTHFQDQHVYRTEWVPGPDGYIAWYLDGEFLYSIQASALNLTGGIIPEEPMYLLFNTAVSSTWGFPMPCPAGCDCDCFDCRDEKCACGIPNKMCENLPASMLIDYVRVYQNPKAKDQMVGCSTPAHPSRRYINGHKKLYMGEDDWEMLKTQMVGGGACRSHKDCGGNGIGACKSKKCVCLDNSNRTGPYCLAHAGFDDIIWDKDDPLVVYMFDLPLSLVMWVVAVLSVLAVIVILKYRHEKSLRLFSKLNNDFGSTGYQALDLQTTGIPLYSYGRPGSYQGT